MLPSEHDPHFGEDAASGAGSASGRVPLSADEPASADELAWLAFRYIAAEMTPQEADEFEQRLAVDQSAREAVAGEVERTQAIAGLLAGACANPRSLCCAEQRVAHPTCGRRHTLRIAGWVGAAVAACMAWLIVSQFLADRAAQPHNVAENNVADHGTAESSAHAERKLASIWATAELPSSPQEEAFGAESPDAETMGVESGDIETARITVPEWMIAAVTAQSRPAAERSDEEMKN